MSVKQDKSISWLFSSMLFIKILPLTLQQLIPAETNACITKLFQVTKSNN